MVGMSIVQLFSYGGPHQSFTSARGSQKLRAIGLSIPINELKLGRRPKHGTNSPE